MSDDGAVDRGTLRAELAEMELRLRLYFDDQLRHKADAAIVVELIRKVDRVDRGEFTDAHARALTDRIEAVLSGRSDHAWTMRERVTTFIGVMTGIATVAIYVLIAIHGGTL